MFGIGGFELFIILVFGFLIFGPDKLPEIAKTVGKGIARFREAQQEMNDTIGGEKIFDPSNPDEPFKDPVEVLDRIAKKQEEKNAGKGKPSSSSSSAAKAKPTSEKAASDAEKAPESGTGASEPAARQESFTERKARYERERAARKAAEEAASKEAAPDDASGDEAGASEKAAPATSGSPATEGGDE